MIAIIRKSIAFAGVILLTNLAGTKLMSQDQQAEAAESLPSSALTLQRMDSLSSLADSLGNYEEAIRAAKTGLVLAKKDANTKEVLKYHLRLAKYYAKIGNKDQALVHFRLFSLAKEEDIKKTSEEQLLRLEDAYLDEITNLVREADLNQTLIDNLTAENESYYQGQRIVSLAVKIAVLLILLSASLFAYNRYSRKKGKKHNIVEQNSELERTRTQLDRVDEELSRSDLELTHLKKEISQNALYAKSIQQSLLPTDEMRRKVLKSSFVISEPKNSVSGDFFYVSTLGGKKVVAVFDCPGHGVDAAHSTLIALTILKDILGQGITAPAMMLTMMDQRLKQETRKLQEREERIGGTKVAICTITTKTKEVEYSGAHFPLFYSHLDELHFVRGNRFPVGDPSYSDKYYSSKKLRLSSGDMIYLSTDGFYSQLGGKGKKRFLRSSMMNLLASILNQSLKEQRFVLEKVYKEWKGKQVQTDDMLVFSIKL